jgi:dTDP-4-dehydrorhamnose 3,5-epimerase
VRFEATPIPGAYVVEIERIEDERGFFARTWCAEEFRRMGLNPNITQCNVSFNARRGTLRGMHFQARPHEEAKVVRCTLGSVHDVIVDIRPGSAQFRTTFTVELSAQNRRMLYIPESVAHGFQTLEDQTEVFYQMTESYHPEAAAGFRWDDAAFGIRWPLEVTVISARDRAYPAFQS